MPTADFKHNNDWQLAHLWIPIFRWADLKLSNARLGDMPVISYAPTHEYHPMSIRCPGLSAVINNQRLILFGGRVVRHQQIILWFRICFYWCHLYRLKTWGARAQCLGGTPESTGTSCDALPSTTTRWVRHVRYVLSHSCSSPRTPLASSFFRRWRWGTLSNAFWRSSNMISCWCFWTIPFCDFTVCIIRCVYRG